MTNKFTTKKLILNAVFIALGVLLPIAFHSFNMGGKIFLPMHIPTLIGGLVLGPISGLLIGIFSPIISSALTGMPPVFPMLPIMIFELATYGLVAGYLRREKNMGIFPSLLIAMLAGRLIAAVVALVLGQFGFKEGPVAYFINAITTGIPGIIIQLIFVPLIARQVEKFLASRNI